MKKLELSFGTRKALSVHVGEAAAAEIVEFLEQLAKQVAELERGKVDVMQIVPVAPVRKKVAAARKTA